MNDFERAEQDYLEPEDEIIAGTCAGCNGDIYEGEEILYVDGMMCHTDGYCLQSMLVEHFGATEEVAREDM